MNASRPVTARAATTAMFFGNGLTMGAWAAAIPTLKAALGLSAASLSLALLALSAGAVTMMPLAGSLAPRLGGSGRTTVLAGIALALVLGLPMLVPGLASLGLLCFLLGANIGLLDVAMNAHASIVERQWGTPIMSSFHAGFSLGGFAGTGLGAVLLAIGVPGWSLMLPAAGIVLVLTLISARYLGPGDVRPASGASFRLPERKVLGLATIALCCFLIEGAMVDWSSLYLITIGATPSTASFGFAAFSVTMVLGRLFGDPVVRVWGGQPVITTGSLIAATGLTLAIVFPQAPVIVFGFALVGVGLSNVVPTLFSASARLGSSPAAGIAATATVGYAGMLFGPPVIGAVAAQWGLRVGVAVMAVAALAAAILSLRTARSTAPRPVAAAGLADRQP
ncbi:MAG: MFS transporter [Azospirillaceae bacterium]|nr:MFS transporter [Azospirillaceae bacterium]